MKPIVLETLYFGGMLNGKGLWSAIVLPPFPLRDCPWGTSYHIIACTPERSSLLGGHQQSWKYNQLISFSVAITGCYGIFRPREYRFFSHSGRILQNWRGPRWGMKGIGQQG